MPRLRIELHPEVVLEAKAARTWYAERNPAAADALTRELDRAIADVSENPSRYSPFEHGTRRYLLRRFPYALIYRIAGEVVTVVAFAHCRRLPGYWKER